MTKKYESHDMMPQDMVELAELRHSRLLENSMRAVENGLPRIESRFIVEALADEVGLTVEELHHYADIGEVVMLDRQLNSMTPDQRFEWEEMKARIVKLVDENLTEDIVKEYYENKKQADEHKNILEEIWKLSDTNSDDSNAD
jgi:hypothetical protein